MTERFAADQALRVGVIGVGVMGRNHARVLAELPAVTIAGIVDPDLGAAKAAAGPVGARTFGTTEELLAAGVDAVIVAAPTQLHHPIALQCLQAGVHCLVEKPIAATAAEGDEIVAAAKARGLTLMVGHVERFNPAVQAIKQAIRDEDILSVQVTRVGPFPPRMSNVGVVIDLAVHDIDLICWFTDSTISEIQPLLASAIAEREDIALLQFRTHSGVLASINTNWLTPFKTRSVQVATRNKYVTGDLITRQVTECFGFQPDGSYSMRHLSVPQTEPLRAELAAFIRAVRTGETPAVTGEAGVASLAVAIQCLEDDSGAGRKRPQTDRKAS
jgi:predicted dehydrogenase